MRRILPALLCLLLLLPSGSLLAQEVELDQKAKELEQLKEKEDRLQKELEAVKKLRERAQEDLRQARAEQMVKAMRARIEELTPRRFTQKVDVGFQTKSEFRAAAEEMMAEELPPELVEGQSTAWAALGLMPLNTDLQEMLLDVVVSQAAAYYNPKTDTFYVVAELPKGQAETIFLHELQHAMQDQVLGLDDIWAKALESGNDDRAQAVRFLVEGEATYLMRVHELGKMLKRMKAPPGQLDAALGAQLKAASNMPYDKMMASMEAMAKTRGGDMAEATRKAKELPPFVMRSLIDAYYRGAYAVHEVKAARGWKGVDELFADPPTSTEQMLHPHKLLGDKREEPIAVEVPVKVARELGVGWTKAYESTLGEASILILLTDQMPKAQRDAAVAAAAGWGGDRFVAFRRLGGIKLVYRFDWKALGQEQRADAYERALTTLHKRFEEAGFDIRPDLNLEGEVNVKVPPAEVAELAGIKKLVASQGTLGFRIVVDRDDPAHKHYWEWLRARLQARGPTDGPVTVPAADRRPEDKKQRRFRYGLRWHRVSDKALRQKRLVSLERDGWILCALDGEDLSAADIKNLAVVPAVGLEGQWLIRFEVRKLAQRAFARLTSKRAHIAILVDDRVMRAPRITDTLSSNGTILGFSEAETRGLAALIKSGDLAEAPAFIEQEQIAAPGARPVLAWLTEWDSVADAEEFELAYTQAAGERNRKREWPAAAILRAGTRVAVVEGADQAVGAQLLRVMLPAR